MSSSRLTQSLRRRLLVQTLEHRDVPAVYTVTALTDTGAGNGPSGDLRYCIAQANANPGADTITFGVTGTITLGGTELTLSDFTAGGTTIIGPGPDNLTINANGASRVMSVSLNVTAALSGMTLTGGKLTFAGAVGGGIYTAGQLTLTECAITGNELPGTGVPAGAGVFVEQNSTATFVKCSITNNVINFGNGGGIFLRGTASGAAVAVLSDSIVSGNVGGGIYSNSIGNLTLTNSTLSGNSGSGLFNAGQAWLSHSTISGNSSGGIFNAGQAMLTNLTISGNSYPSNLFGAGIHNSGNLTVTNSTVSGNTGADGGTGGIKNSGGSATLTNTIVAGNTAPGNADLTGSFTETNCLVNMSAAAAGLGAFGLHGGATQTIPLLPGSPAIDAGASTALTTDQRGVPRAQFNAIDIGAVEATRADLGLPFVTTPDAAQWYVGPNNSGDQRVYRETAGFNQQEVGGLAARVGLANGSVVVQTTAGDVYARIGSASGVGSAYQLLPHVTAADGANWFLAVDGPDMSNRYIYRWAAGESATYADGWGIQLFVTTAGAVIAESSNGIRYIRVGSAAGLGSSWQLLQESLVVTTLVDENDNTSNATIGSGTSLREALAYANNLPGADTITFAAALAGQTVTLSQGWNNGSDDTALRNSSDVTIDGGTGIIVNLNPSQTRRIFHNSSTGFLTLKNLTLSGGDIRTVGDGGAIWNSGRVDLSNTRLTNNKANNGGAIVTSGPLNITDSIFDNNSTAAGGVGGAISIVGGACDILRGSFSNNQANLGGAINSADGLTITNTTFNNNTASFNGGALRLFGTTNVSGTTLNNNAAANDGGAIMSHGNTTITNSTLANNTASVGGGINYFEGSGAIRNATIAYNSATNLGGGTYVGTANVTAVNSIVSGNSAPTGPNDAGAAFVSGSSNNVLNLSATIAGLSALASNGGPTQTIALLPGSPAINGGNAVGAPTTDQRGLPRVGTTDIGAFEAQTLQPVKVNQISINGGSVQRSRLTSVEVTFDHLVSFSTTPAAGFQLQRQSDGQLVNLSGSVNATGNVVTLTFLAGDAVNFGSLADGRYTLTIKAAGFASDGFDGNNDGTGGDDFQMIGSPANGLFRLFGDADGNGTVSATDFNAFRLQYGSVGPSIFDFNNDNSTAAADFNEFRLRYGSSI